MCTLKSKRLLHVARAYVTVLAAVSWRKMHCMTVDATSSLPSLLEFVEAMHGFGSHVAAVSVPKLHDDVPDTVYPVSHVG